MANDTFPLGRNARLYYNTTPVLVTTDAATWLALGQTVVANQVRNLALSLDNENVDTNTRETTSGGFASQTPVLKSAEVTFDTPWDLSEAFVTSLITAWSGNTKMALGILNRDKDTGPVTGDIVNGFVGNFWVSLSKDENADDVQRANWTITHADFGEWYSVTTP